MNRNDKLTIMPFDMVEAESLLIMGLEMKRFANTMVLAIRPAIKIIRPSDSELREFLTYIGKDNKNDLMTWVEHVHHPKFSLKLVMAIKTKPKSQTINIVKKVHRFTHASAKGTVHLLKTT